MKKPYAEIDIRKKEDIMAHIREISRQYTPEWRLDEDNPDFGSVLAKIYAEMTEDVIKRLNMSLERNHVAFLNQISAALLPAIPAKGYVTFGLPDMVEESVQVPKRTQLLADEMDENASNLIFETTDDVYVSPAKLLSIFTVNASEDTIYRQFSVNDIFRPFFLFDETGQNLQKHQIILEHSYLLDMPHGGEVYLQLDMERHQEILEGTENPFLNKNQIEFFYETETGVQYLHQKALVGNVLTLEKPPGEILASEDGIRQIHCLIHQAEPFSRMSVHTVRLGSKKKNLEPECVYADNEEQDVHRFLPFGEQPSIFDEVYFISREVLGKKHAKITIQFDLDFLRVPIENLFPEENREWKAVMKKSDFKPDKEYDITIEEIIWEYNNGLGWTRLFPQGDCQDILTTKNGTLGQRKKLTFICPDDMEPALVNAQDSYCIRARITKINNAYKTNGFYITPLFSEVYMSYDYSRELQLPQAITFEDNMECKRLEKDWFLRHKDVLLPLAKKFYENTSVCYLGFDRPLEEGPIKLFMELYDILDEVPILDWEYLSDAGWRSLNALDETEGLKKTGLVTWSAEKDFKKLCLFGEDGYWIRIVDKKNAYHRRRDITIPKIQSIHLNTTKIINLESVKEELYFVEKQAENQKIKLTHENINAIEVWNDEYNSANIRELQNLEREGKARFEFSSEGDLERAWVLWEEVSDFMESGLTDRHYILDRNSGILQFADGIHGMIPKAKETESILTAYTTGGGSIANLAADTIHTLSRSVGFVTNITNPVKTFGGCDKESISHALGRNADTIKHRFRCVTEEDYEAIVRMKCRNISKVRCLSGINEKGQALKGGIVLVVLADDAENCGDAFEYIKKELLRELPQYMAVNVMDMNRLKILPPKFVEIRVRATIQVRDYNTMFDIKNELTSSLEKFLDANTGNFDKNGWNIGDVPKLNQIQSLMKGIKGVEFVTNIVVDTYITGRFGKTQVFLDQIDTVFLLPKSGEHEMILQIEKR